MTKKALLVGINDYAPVGAGGPDLNGCVNDVRDMASTLCGMGIIPASSASLRILTDVRATRKNILDGLKWLVTGAKTGDVLVFHYSGHGTQVADIHGDEPDKWDEAICPHDFSTAGFITDDTLRNIFKGVSSGVNLDVILDSCFSGTGTRALQALDLLPEGERIFYRYLEPPLDYGFFLDANPDLPVEGFARWNSPEATTRDAVEVPNLNHVLWAGCRDNQTSAEKKIDGAYRGVHTYSFCQCLRRLGLGITRRQLDKALTLAVKNQGVSQIPQTEGSKKSLGEKVFN
jgi:hypothetical protein